MKPSLYGLEKRIFISVNVSEINTGCSVIYYYFEKWNKALLFIPGGGAESSQVASLHKMFIFESA